MNLPLPTYSLAFPSGMDSPCVSVVLDSAVATEATVRVRVTRTLVTRVGAAIVEIFALPNIILIYLHVAFAFLHCRDNKN